MSEPLKKSIGFFPLTMIAAGACIGAGIFISPSDVAGQLADGRQILFVWLIGGVVTITGALSFGELASRFPGTGGVYVYIREAYGKLAAFLYGWCILTVITSGAIAALCIAFARYLTLVLNLKTGYEIYIGLAALLLVTLINIRGVKWSSLFASTITVMKVGGIIIIVIACLVFGQNFFSNMQASINTSVSVSFGVALVGVLWSYGGWHHASYVSGEVHDAHRIVPRALITGGLIVTLVYIAVNAAYLSVMTRDEIAASPAIASDALAKITPMGGLLIGVLIAFSAFGTAGIFTMSTPRIYYQMAKDRVFFPWLADVHAGTGAPVNAIIFQSIWAGVLMIVWGTFESLATYVVFMDWIFMTMAAAAIFIFRRNKKSTAASYHVPFYPVVPVIFIGISLWFLLSTILGRPVQAVAGIILLLIGLPVYFISRKKATTIDELI